MKKPKNLQDLIQALYQSNKTGSATYWIDSPEETVQESLVDEELVIVYRGRGEESEKVYQGDFDSYKYKRAIDRDKQEHNNHCSS